MDAPLPPALADVAIDRAAIRRVLAGARFRDRGALTEPEGLALLQAAGIGVPRHLVLPDAEACARLPDPPLPGAPRVVLKIVSPDVLHKTESGGVAVLANGRAEVLAAARAMTARIPAGSLAGFLLAEFVPHEPGLGGEFLLGLRFTRDFGPVVTLGPGGIHAEFTARALRDDVSLAHLSPGLGERDRVGRAIAGLACVRLATEPQRGRPARLPAAAIVDAVRRFLALAAACGPESLAELEVNPLVASDGRLVALDALCTLGAASPTPAPPRAPRPLARIGRLLAPRSIAVVGASEKAMNPGRVIVRNVLREGFDPARLTVVKPGLETLDGCRCVASLADLPEPVDLVVLSVPAPQAVEMIVDVATHRRAESVVLVSGGLEERPGQEALLARVRAALEASRATPWGGPVVNGGNCLGVRSQPGRYNTLFIPDTKLPLPAGPPDPLALVTGSGAFAVSKSSKLEGLHPRYAITVGNQMDLTVADYLHHLKADAAIEVFGVYAEGFQPLDGARFVEAAAEITASGRTVVLYRGGRTEAGAAAAASHTAAVAGDHAIGRRLAEEAGVVVADTLADFEDLVRLFVLLRDRRPRGLRLGAISNAGYECVAIADAIGPFSLAGWSAATRARLEATLERAKLAGIVGVRNPIDLTPILGDAGTAEIVGAVLEDDATDAGLVGLVPLTPALDTLAAGPGHGDDLAREDGIVRRLLRLRAASPKPWVAVVDAGPLYDPMARALEAGRVPTFRTADRAMRLFGRYCRRWVGAA